MLKRISGSIFILLGAMFVGWIPAHAGTVIQSTPAAGLAAYWSFDGTAINWGIDTVFDKSGNGNNGTMAFMSASANSVPGKEGQALLFNGLVTSVGLASSPLANMSSPSSACAWANDLNTSLTPAGFNQTILDFSIDANNGVRMGSLGSSGDLFVSYELGGIPRGVQSTASVFKNGQWVFVCYVWDGSGLTLYANADSLATTTNLDYIGTPSTLGAQDNGGGGVWDGALDEIHVYNRAFSATEVLRLYHSSMATIGKVPSGHAKIDVAPTSFLNSGLVGYWPFDGKTMNWTANTAADASGNGNNGQLYNMSTTTSPAIGKIGQALSFNGTNGYVNVPTASILNPSYLTVSAWVKTSSSGLYILALDPPCSKSVAHCGPYSLSTVGGGQLGVSISSLSNEISVSSSVSVVDGKWHHIAGTYDGSNMKIYVDGKQTGISTLSGTSYTGNNPVRIGANDQTTPGAFFAGSIDDVRVYNRALSASEVQQLYLMGK